MSRKIHKSKKKNTKNRKKRGGMQASRSRPVAEKPSYDSSNPYSNKLKKDIYKKTLSILIKIGNEADKQKGKLNKSLHKRLVNMINESNDTDINLITETIQDFLIGDIFNHIPIDEVPKDIRLELVSNFTKIIEKRKAYFKTAQYRKEMRPSLNILLKQSPITDLVLPSVPTHSPNAGRRGGKRKRTRKTRRKVKA